jgi:hypothetical protein
VVGVALMKAPNNITRSCAMSGSSRRAAVEWLSQVGGKVVYIAQANRIAENNASLGTLRHSSELSTKLLCTLLKLSILPARNHFCIKPPFLISGAMHHSLRRLRLVEYGGLSAAVCSLVEEAVICFRQVDNLKLFASRHCDRRRYRIRLEGAVHSHSRQFTGLPVL